ncbi:DUF2058 domain-containing protein [Lysobacter sp. D1-1-M9]|uniref:DUF2058 domain-containing protein n=1 Tax=Novilysobacter longmucuonensis TaxID=3098603 RepID=UPI002FCA0613
MRNPLQEQLLKAGLIKKSQAAELAREQARQRKGKAPPPAPVEQVDTQQLQAQRAERDRALSAERNAQARLHEQRAQVRQLIETNKVGREGEIAYRFPDQGRIRSVLVTESLRTQLASGALVIARHGDGYELLPRAAADKIRARDAAAIVLDHGRTEDTAAPDKGEDDDFYKQFQVPDDLIW